MWAHRNHVLLNLLSVRGEYFREGSAVSSLLGGTPEHIPAQFGPGSGAVRRGLSSLVCDEALDGFLSRSRFMDAASDLLLLWG